MNHSDNSEMSWWPVLLLGLTVVGVLYLIRGNLPPLILAGIVAYLVSPTVDIGERRGLPRWASIAIVYVLIGGLIALSVGVLVPILIDQGNELKDKVQQLWPQLPALIHQAQMWIQQKIPASRSLLADFKLDERAITTVQEWATEFIAAAPAYISGALTNVVNILSYFVMVPFIAFFLIRDGRQFKRGLVQLVPNRYFETTLSIISKIEDQVGRYIRGLLLEASAIGIMSSIGLIIVGLNGAVLIGLVAGIANMIPYLGPIIGTTVGLIVALSTGGSVLGVIIVFASVQFIDNWVFQPVVMSRSVSMHPLLVFLAVVFGGSYGGLLGMVLAVPLVGAVIVTITTLRAGLRPSAHLVMEEA
jgi:predicted PurR-regulated permease PerM